MNRQSSAAGTGRESGIFFLYKELWRLACGERRRLIGAMVLLVSAQVILLCIPYIAGRAIDALQMQGSGGLFDAGRWLLLMLGVTAASWLLHGPGRILERNVALSIRQRIATGLAQHLMALPLSWHESNHSGATAHRVQQSSTALSAFAQSQFIYLSSAVRLVGPMIALWLLAPAVGVAAVLGFCAICLAVIGFDRAMIRLAHVENDAERRYAATLIDTLGNSTSLFALRQARGIIRLLQQRLQGVFVPLKRAIVLNEAKWCSVDIASKALSCGLVALFAWLSLRHAHGSATQQTLLLGSVYMVWEYASQAGGVISAVAAHFQTFARQHADYASADVIRNAPLAHYAEVGTPAGSWQRCEIRDVVFRHVLSREAAPSLDHVSLTLERGKRYALVGASGSGKSTLLRVLAGLYAAERMVVACNGGPLLLAVEAARFLRNTTTLIPQNAEVAEGTLAENLGLCESLDGAPPGPRYRHALEAACVSDFIAVDEASLHVRIAERAANWSGGQRARVALARGILAAHGSGMVLLDEPTANLDPRTEAMVYANVFEEFREACLVSSIHRLHLLDRFDEVIVMHGGRVVAQGPAATLAAVSPDFRRLLATYREEEGAPASAVA